jgi:hypothetical protein
MSRIINQARRIAIRVGCMIVCMTERAGISAGTGVMPTCSWLNALVRGSPLRRLRSQSGYFGGLCPLDALLRGHIDGVDAALEALDSGVFL